MLKSTKHLMKDITIHRKIICIFGVDRHSIVNACVVCVCACNSTQVGHLPGS